MILKREVLKNALNIISHRPSADLSIEQYLVTAEILAVQVINTEAVFRDKKILQLGNDDHLSVLFAHHLSCRPFVAELDARVRTSLKKMYQKYNIECYDIIEYKTRNILPDSVTADPFYINPPYSSKNNGKGGKVWTSNVVQASARDSSIDTGRVTLDAAMNTNK